MITTPSAAIANQLFAETGFPLLSLYMPAYRAGASVWQNPIRFKNLMRSAEHDLEAAGTDAGEIKRLMRPLQDLQEDREYWQHQGDGLAVFRSREGLAEFRLAIAAPELCVVGDRYHLKPLLLAIANEQPFYVAAVSQHAARLYRGSQSGLVPVEGLEFPEGVDTSEHAPEKMMQAHAAGGGAQILHAAEPDKKRQIADYCRQVDEVVRSVAGPRDFVILAAVDYVADLYRGVTSLRGLAATTVAGNPDHLGASHLFEKALPIARDHFASRVTEAGNRFQASLRTGHALENPVETIQAARQGRVDTLLVPMGVQVWGRFGDDGAVTVHEQQELHDEDLLNAAVIDTWKSGGDVVVVEEDQMPGGRKVAAITRF